MPPPAIASTLRRHWDASVLALADGAVITSWADLAGGGPAAFPTGGGPTFEVGDSPLGNMPGVRFANTQSLTASTGPLLSTITAFMVLRNPPSDVDRHNLVPMSNGHLLFTEFEGTTGRWVLGRSVFNFIEFTDAALLNTHCLWTWVQAGASSKVRANQVQRATGNGGGPDSSTVIGFGDNTGGQNDFTAYEVLIYEGIVSPSDIDIIEDYLYAKWFVLPPPPAPGGVTATSISTSDIDLDWTDVAGETGYRVERSADGTTGWTDVSGALAAGTITYTDDGLAGGTEYFYRIIAFSASGDSAPSTVVSATTDAPAPPDPPVLEGVTTRVTDTTWETVLTWDDVADETGYRIETSADGEDPWSPLATLAANVVTYTVSQPSNQTIFFRVVAINASGEALSNFVSGITGDDFANFIAEARGVYVYLFVTVPGLPDGSTVTVSRIDRFGKQIIVRGGQDADISGDVWEGTDYEAPQGVPLTYRADVDNGTTITTYYATMEGLIDYGGDWIMPVGYPDFGTNIIVEYGGVGALDRQIQQDTAMIINRDSPVVVSWGRKMWAATITVLTLEEPERFQLVNLLDFPVLMFAARPGFGVEDPVFLSVGGVSEERTSGLGSESSRRFVIQVQQVARPPAFYPPPIPAFSWQDRLDEDRTWGEVLPLFNWYDYAGYP